MKICDGFLEQTYNICEFISQIFNEHRGTNLNVRSDVILIYSIIIDTSIDTSNYTSIYTRSQYTM